MRAITAGEFGGPEVLEFGEAPDPAPGPGQILIDVAIADVLFLDTALRSGAGADHFPVRQVPLQNGDRLTIGFFFRAVNVLSSPAATGVTADSLNVELMRRS